MTYVLALPCIDVKDTACVEECAMDCICEGERMIYIHPDECVGCVACAPVCRAEAIYYKDDLPEQWTDYYKTNIEFFDDLDHPVAPRKLVCSQWTTPHGSTAAAECSAPISPYRPSQRRPNSDLASRIYPMPGDYAGAPAVDQEMKALTNHGL